MEPEERGFSPRGANGVTLCGHKGRLAMPGIFSRMELKRCSRCCDLAKVPRGYGAPFNAEGNPPWKNR